ADRGPSPRAWGSLAGDRLQLAPRRSIPTCVGLTSLTSGPVSGTSVHPHVRGAHAPPANWRVARRRSIPTCVGLTEADLRLCGALSPRYLFCGQPSPWHHFRPFSRKRPARGGLLATFCAYRDSR